MDIGEKAFYDLAGRLVVGDVPETITLTPRRESAAHPRARGVLAGRV